MIMQSFIKIDPKLRLQEWRQTHTDTQTDRRKWFYNLSHAML